MIEREREREMVANRNGHLVHICHLGAVIYWFVLWSNSGMQVRKLDWCCFSEIFFNIISCAVGQIRRWEEIVSSLPFFQLSYKKVFVCRGSNVGSVPLTFVMAVPCTIHHTPTDDAIFRQYLHTNTLQNTEHGWTWHWNVRVSFFCNIYTFQRHTQCSCTD